MFGQAPPVTAQHFDALDRRPLRWRIADNDCRATLAEHRLDATGGHDGGACEQVTVRYGHGTRLFLEYRIEPSRVIDEFAASLHVRAARAGNRIGVRVRYPYVHNPETGRTVAVTLMGQATRDRGRWEKIGIANLGSQLREKEAALRVRFGRSVDLRAPFVDAVLVDIFQSAGVSTVRLDDLTIQGLVPVSSVAVAARPSAATTRLPSGANPDALPPAFPRGRITKIIEHQGEPLSYLQSLGFDAVLLRKPPSADQLSEAMRVGLQLYAPPPSGPDLDLEPLLDPVAGWYLGTSQDRSDLDNVRGDAERLRGFPRRWQRGLCVAAAEAWSDYAAGSLALIYDLPPTSFGLSPAEEFDYAADIRERTRGSVPFAFGIQTAPAPNLLEQVGFFANGIGAGSVDDFGWHPMWLQTIRALAHGPQALLFRSTRSLTSGEPADQKRALALGFINRQIASIGPLVAASVPQGTFATSGVDYTAQRLARGGTDIVLATSNAAGPVNVLAGDGEVLTVQLPPTMNNRFVWRLTSFSSERVELEATPRGPAARIVSPDAVEILVVSDDTTLGHRLTRRLDQLAMPAALQRWQLTTEAVIQTRTDWESLVASRLAAASDFPIQQLTLAANTLADGEPMYRAGDGPMTLRMARRADAWMLRSRERLLGRLLPNDDRRVHLPPMHLAGGAVLQIPISAQLRSGRWSRNLLPSDAFDSAKQLAHSGWTHDRRESNRAISNLEVIPTDPNAFAPALRVEVTPTGAAGLAGGYAGTMVRVHSPAVDTPADKLVRLSCQVRTLGFAGPFQGALVYDALGGAELGVLVRSPSDWQTVELYRHTGGPAPMRLMFEVIGGGEVLMRNAKIEIWDSRPPDPKILTPITRDVRRRGDRNDQIEGPGGRF